MTYNILFTSLYESGKGLPIRYYCAEEREENKYTDALLTAEATTKCLLSSERIDEIFVLGDYLTSEKDDIEKSFDISDGNVFYGADLKTLSAVNLFRCRLAQFRDDLCLDLKTYDDGISEEEQKKIEDFINQFYKAHSDNGRSGKFNRFFDRLTYDPGLYEDLKREMMEAFPEAKGKEAAYLMRVRNYLYLQLRDFSKLSILQENENTKLQFFSTMDEDDDLPAAVMMKLAKKLMDEGSDGINIYMALNNDNVEDNFILLGVLGILDMMNGEQIQIKRICTPTEASSHLAGLIQESTETYGLTSMSAAVKTFLKYGKADMIVECWENSGSKNKQIEKMIYAMRRIDTGLSLCSINDLVKGIATLRELFSQGFDVSADDPVARLFVLMSEGVKKDYGALVTSEEAGFIELIKWAFSKGFYQACLTLIEAKAPGNFVPRGMLYYCNDESQKDHVTELFARKRMQMKSYEYWKMNDIDHYFIKNYFLYKFPNNTMERQRENGKQMVACIDNTNPDYITGYTACDDRQALEDLMFSYMRIGTIRNKTNHAEETEEEEFTLFPDEKEESSKLREITEAIQFFIQSFDKVSENISGKNPVVVRITSDEVKRMAQRLEEKEKAERKKNQNEKIPDADIQKPAA